MRAWRDSTLTPFSAQADESASNQADQGRGRLRYGYRQRRESEVAVGVCRTDADFIRQRECASRWIGVDAETRAQAVIGDVDGPAAGRAGAHPVVASEKNCGDIRPLIKSGL